MPALQARLAAVTRFAAHLRELGPANFLYSDGSALFAHGHRRAQANGSIAPPGLWRLQRSCPVDPDTLARAGVHLETTAEPQRLALMASVPLADEPWRPLLEGEVIAIEDGLELAP